MATSPPPAPDDPRATHEAAATLAGRPSFIAAINACKPRYRELNSPLWDVLEEAERLSERTQKLEEALDEIREMAARWEERDGQMSAGWVLRRIDAALASVVRDG